MRQSRAQIALGRTKEEKPQALRVKVPETVIDYLEQQYPDICPSPKMSREEFLVYAAKRELIRELKNHV